MALQSGNGIVRGLGVLFSLLALIAAAVAVVLVINRLERRPRTNDGYLAADIVHMAPEVSGRIVRLDVQNNRYVRRGDELFVIDPEPFQYAFDAASAKLASLRAQYYIDIRQVASQNSRAAAAQSSTKSNAAQLALAQTTLKRLEPLGAQGFVTREQVDRARTAVRTASAGLASSRSDAQAAQQAVTDTKPLEAQIKEAEADLANAARNLRLTVVRAPCDGQITALTVAAGEFATEGKPVFTIIDTDRWYAVGNFRETNLAGIHPGQHATVWVLGFGAQALDGHVDSLNGGVVPDEGAVSDGLPDVPRSLEWVRIAQRFPVRILLDKPPPALMRIGATASIMIDR
ncbi:HlyD family efflux transporter periplasmic adaptor subunit [Rhizosaccharibacter radicis]|uniref:HlyD family efflux transporter periplasmic adaptor subunit n=1 Tax=Rhizosaccharibacter radicis TaxID=2782605 RepID=A0ABT1VWN5_9PROT|nr:HlyD family efflux transporter periplasmic adaptor subunit [Acetobacteraceae bacterium KSS12]